MLLAPARVGTVQLSIWPCFGPLDTLHHLHATCCRRRAAATLLDALLLDELLEDLASEIHDSIDHRFWVFTRGIFILPHGIWHTVDVENLDVEKYCPQPVHGFPHAQVFPKSHCVHTACKASLSTRSESLGRACVRARRAEAQRSLCCHHGRHANVFSPRPLHQRR